MKYNNSSGIPFWDYIDMQIQKLEDGYAELTLEIYPNLLQSNEWVDNGILATLIDASIASALRTKLEDGLDTATVELKTNFIRPAKGKCLTARAFLSHQESTLAVGKSQIFDEDEILVAIGTGTFFVLNR
jgi:uncharacterized protein (TIGR00369 family)